MVEGISRHACRGVVGQRQFAENPIILGDEAAERGMNEC